MREAAVRGAAPVALTLLTALGALTNQHSLGPGILLVAIMALSSGVVAWLRPTGWPLVAGLVVPAATLVLACHSATSSSNIGWFGLCVLAGWLALEGPLGPAAVGTAALVGVAVAEWIAMPDDAGWPAWAGGTIFTMVAGTFARRQRQLADELRAAQAGLAERARTDERNRIAAEMHDVLGHALTVSLLHVGSARLVLDEDPEEARESLAEAERLVRVSLDEVRAVVGAVRTDGTGDVAPAPSAADLPELIESFRRAGTAVDLDLTGDLSGLGGTHGLAVYRIVQESLTNAARHGRGSTVSVRIDAGEAETSMRIVNHTDGGTNASSGTGLIAMRERAEALGGRVEAGRRGDRWTVEAMVPA